MSTIYDQHASAFPHMSAYVILKDGERVATVAVKYSARSTRVWAYLHVLSLPMVRACADGGGYDKTSAAIAKASQQVRCPLTVYYPGNAQELHDLAQFWNDLSPSLDKGHEWTRALELAGFTVLQAV